MSRKVQLSSGSARTRVGLPVLSDGTRRRPLLLRLPSPDVGPEAHGPGEASSVEEAELGRCQNACADCITLPLYDENTGFESDVAGKHVVLRHREPTLRPDLPRLVASIRQRGAASITVLTNGRTLVHPTVLLPLARAGVDRFIVKLFGLSAAEHDAHTRSPGSFAQAIAGVAAARMARVEVHVTFPLPIVVKHATNPAERQAQVELRKALAKKVTGVDPVEMPEPEVEAHPNEYRYDVVALRGKLTHPAWTESFFPMVHIHTGPVCNIRCTYCNVHGGDDQRIYGRDYMERLIDDAAERILGGWNGAGHPTVDFIGGEPTLHPELPRLIRYAKDKGFPKVFICTNGVLLLRPGYLQQLVDAGLTGVRFSFHEHRPEMANQLADVEGLGTRYVDVARTLLAQRDLHVHLYRIILSSTIDAIPDYLRWLAEHNHTGKPLDLTFGMPSMRGRLFENRHLYPDLASLRGKIDAAMAVALELGINPLFHHSPGCVYPAEPGRTACLHIKTMQFDVAGKQEVTNFEGDARYGKACEGCSGKVHGCAGVPSAYWDMDAQATEAWLRPIDYVPERAE